MIATPQRSRRPPIQPVWVITAAISTIVLLLLTAWRMLVPPEVTPPPAANERIVSDTKPAIRQPVAKERNVERMARADQRSSVDASGAAAGLANSAKRDAAADSTSTVKTAVQAKSGAPQNNSVGPPKRAGSEPVATNIGQQPPPVAESPSRPAAAKEEDASRAIVEALQAKAPPAAAQPAREHEGPKKMEAADRAAEARRWLAAAKQFAARHQGLVFEARPFPAGELSVPGGFEGPLADQPFWFLGGGQLEVHSGVYAFGLGYEQALPVMRQELPELATQLGLASVAVELRHHGNDLVIRAVATPKPNGPEVIAEKRNEIAQLQNRRDRLNYQLREWRQVDAGGDSTETKAKKAAIREAMLAVLEAPTRSPAEYPSPSGPRKGGDSVAAAAKPQQRPAQAVTARDRSLYSAETLARNEISNLDLRIRQLQTECNAALAQSRGTNDRAVEQFEEGCRRITVVIYQSVKAQPDPAAGSAAPSRREEPAAPPQHAAQPPQRAEAGATTPAELKPTKDVAQWAVQYRVEISENAFAPTYTDWAQLTVQAVSASGSVLPKRFHDEFSVNCTVCEYAKDGAPHLRDLINAGKPRTCNVTEGTTQMAVRFWLARKSAPAGGNVRPVAETSWYIMDAVRRGAVYHLKAPLTQEMLISLQAKPSPPTKPGSGKKPR
jgi:hypothetical protein